MTCPVRDAGPRWIEAEPRSTDLRRRLAARLALLSLAALIFGCGNAGTNENEPSSASSAPSASPTAGFTGCGDDADRATATRLLGRLDLDADGTKNQLRLVTAGPPGCRGAVLATVGGRVVGVALDGPPPAAGRAVRIPGHSGELMVTRSAHPLGGFQATLLGYADGTLEAVSVAGKPLFGFVATDTGGGFLSAHCTSDGFVVRTTRAHEPPGVVTSLDVDATRYRLEGNSAERVGKREVADNVLPQRLPRRFPAMARRTLFRNC